MSIGWFSKLSNQRSATHIQNTLQSGFGDDYTSWMIPNESYGPPTYIISYTRGDMTDLVTLTYDELQAAREDDKDLIVYAWRRIQESGVFAPPAPEYIRKRMHLLKRLRDSL